MFKNFFFKSLLAFLLTFTLIKGASAAGMTISPPKFEYEIEPGSAVVGEIKITNNEETELTLTTDIQDFIAGGESGQPQFINPEDNESSISLGKWIQILDEGIVITPGEVKVIQFSINVPENAEPGGHYGTIFFTPPSEEGQLSIVQKLGSLVLVRVKGDVEEKGNLETYGTYVLPEGSEFDTAVEKTFYETTPVKFLVRYQNEGNVHLKPTGKIEIFNIFGQKLEQIGIQDILNAQGVRTDQEIADYIPVNQALGNVLAKSTRMFTMEYQGKAFWYRFDDGSKELRYKGFPVGKYTAKLTLMGAGGEEITKETTFIIFPWKIIFGYGLFAIILILLIVKFIKWRSKSLREKIKKELQKELKS